MTIATVRRLAADILSVGQNKVKISPDGLKEAEGALTRADVKGLIDKGIVTKLKPQGRASTRRVTRRGRGRRKGITSDSKDVWMDKVRSQRKFLAMMVSTSALRKEAKREIYNKVKSGIFRNKRAMLLYLKDNKFVAADYEPPKPVFKKPEPKLKKAEAAKAAPAAKPMVPGARPAAPTTAKPPQPKAVEKQGERR
ncbi:MAG: 50S ribosomal protein L19e [Candidatus ainarchaeum sp.]|nr:50S ribosomal protein L19e [Candidatus ainarchaeum sp.]